MCVDLLHVNTDGVILTKQSKTSLYLPISFIYAWINISNSSRSFRLVQYHIQALALSMSTNYIGRCLSNAY